MDRLCLNQRQPREYDDSYGDRMKADEMRQLMGACADNDVHEWSPEVFHGGGLNGGGAEEAGGDEDKAVGTFGYASRRPRPSDLDSITMSNASFESRAMPVRTKEQVRNYTQRGLR